MALMDYLPTSTNISGQESHVSVMLPVGDVVTNMITWNYKFGMEIVEEEFV